MRSPSSEEINHLVPNDHEQDPQLNTKTLQHQRFSTHFHHPRTQRTCTACSNSDLPSHGGDKSHSSVSVVTAHSSHLTQVLNSGRL